MVKSFEVYGLYGKINHKIDFHEDLTVLTGLNGSGKTSILKLLWCLLSTNKSIPLTEMVFDRAVVETDKYRLEVLPDYENVKSGPRAARFTVSLPDGNVDPVSYDVLYDSEAISPNGWRKLEALNDSISNIVQDTIYFPTFRRIEGGFETADELHMRKRRMPTINELAYAVNNFSLALSTCKHKFISSIGTKDVERMLLSVNNEINANVNHLYLEFSKYIERALNQRNKNADDTDARKALFEIEKKLDGLKEECAKMRKPLDELSNLVAETFKNSGVTIGEGVILGDGSSPVSASALSAGEKQMLSFLTYNAFSKNTIIFVDEPELNLHVCWQRRLFDRLLTQETSNQFIIATHSPFIYTRYPRNEYFLDANRGENE